MNPTNAILLTIDVEDWFQVENFKQYIPFSSWPSHKLRVEKNTHRILDLLDSTTMPLASSTHHPVTSTQQLATSNQINPKNTTSPSNPMNPSNPKNTINPKNSPKATFFVLGWIAERLPHLIREIHSRGHEVASHGYRHNLCIDCSPKDLRTDLINSKNLLEDIIGDRVYGFRAPSFSINHDILKIIEESGYLYDSSYNSFGMHGRYGHLDLSQNGTRGIALQIPRTKHQEPRTQNPESRIQNPEPSTQNPEPRTLYELPISNIRLGNRVFPWGGGAYFRLIPFPIFKLGVQSILRKKKAYLLYLHPWEIDSEQPRVSEAPWFLKFRHYVNLSKTHSKLSKFIRNFQQHRFITCSQYISELEN